MANLTDNTSKLILKKLNSSPAFLTKQLLDYGVEKPVIESFIKGITKESIKQTIENTIRNYEQEE